MRPERGDARGQRYDGRDAQRPDEPPPDAVLPRGRAVREPVAAEQRADDDGEPGILDRHRHEPQETDEAVVHPFTLNV